MIKEATQGEIKKFFDRQDKKVITFLGFSSAGYEDNSAMLETAGEVLDEFDPQNTIVNIGATPEGIGAVYPLAHERGFVTTGIVSILARQFFAEISPYCEYVFYVQDEGWGGFLPGTNRLSPTSTTLVENSDQLVAIGGGNTAKEIMIGAKSSGKTIRYFEAEKNHQVAIQHAVIQGQPIPVDFKGEVAKVF